MSLDDRIASAIRFPRDLHAEVTRVADERDTSVNHLVVKALRYYLHRLPPLELPGEAKAS